MQYCYSSCEFDGGDTQGEIIGQWDNSSTSNVSNSFYTNDNVKGIGSKGTVNTEITPQEDVVGVTEKIKKLESFETFKEWIKNKFSNITFE